mgnify:CR=1 FL=1
METRLTNKFQAVPMFAQYYGEYYIDIGDEDWKLLELFFSKEHRVANSPDADGYGTILNNYDGSEESVSFEGETYYIFYDGNFH